MNTHNFASNLRTLRQAKGLTQLEISQLLNIQRQSYCNYENGHRLPALDLLLQIADIFHISVDFLIRGAVDSMDVSETKVPALTQDFAQILMDYQSLSPKTQQEVRDFIAFKLRDTSA